MLGKASPPVSDYYPSKLDQTTVGSSTNHTFLVYSKDDKHGAPHTSILNAILRHRIHILSQVGYLDEKLGGYVQCLSCDLKNADISADGLTLELRMLKSVTTTKSVKMENRIFEGLFFPLTLLDKRVIALSAGITFLLEERLKSRDEKEALVDVGRIYALNIVEQVRKQFSPNVSPKVIQDNVNDYFKTAGLGRLNFQVSQEKSFQAAILDPPLSEIGEATGNHLLHGIVVGLVEALDNRSMIVMQDHYDPRTRRLTFQLVEKSIAKTSSEQLLKPSLPKAVQAQALDEVEKVIKSLENAGSELDDRTPLVIEVRGGKSESATSTLIEGPPHPYYTEKGPSAEIRNQNDRATVEKIDTTLPVLAEAKQPLDSVEKVEIAPEAPKPEVARRISRKTRSDEEATGTYNQELRDSDDLFFEDSSYL